MANLEAKVNLESLDETLEKANHLVELLREAVQIIDSLSRIRKTAETSS